MTALNINAALRNSFFAALAWLIALPGSSHAIPSVTVMGDKSMSHAIILLAREYSSQNHVVVNTAFTTKERQEQQILDGGAADIVITASEEWIDNLKLQGLIDVYTKTHIASDRLVLTAPNHDTLDADLKQNFPTGQLIRAMDWEQAFVLGHPQTQIEGSYAKQALRNLQAASDLEPYTLYIKRYDDMIEMAQRPGSFGVFFHSTVKRNDTLRVVDFFPQESYQPVDYYAAVVAGDNMNEARKFLQYLSSEEAQKILLDNGLSKENI